MSSQLYDLSTNEMLIPMFPNLRTLANVLYVTSSWDSIKLFKNENDKNSTQKQKTFSYLMKISIESLQNLTDEDLEMMIEI